MSAESYAIVFAALLLLAGRLADLYGARQLFLIGLAVFGLTSLLAALAPGGGLLILARFAQGVGGAMILPTSLALVNAAFSGEARGKAFAVWGSTIGAAAAVGPLLGGWLADFSWRWAFGINIPAVILIAVAVLRYLPASTPVRGRVDIIGALLSICGLGLLSFGLIEGRAHGWLRTTEPLSIAGFDWTGGPSPVAVAFVLSAATLAAFWIRQARLGRTGGEPLMDVKLFGISSFRQGNAVTLLVGLGEFGIIAVLPLWLQFTLGRGRRQRVVVDRDRPVHLWHRRRIRHRARDQRGARRCPGTERGPRLGYSEHRPRTRLGPRHRAAHHPVLQRARLRRP